MGANLVPANHLVFLLLLNSRICFARTKVIFNERGDNHVSHVSIYLLIMLKLKPAYLLYVQGVKDSFNFLSRYGLVHSGPPVTVTAAHCSSHERGFEAVNCNNGLNYHIRGCSCHVQRLLMKGRFIRFRFE